MIFVSEYSYALISSLFWALSAPILNVGIKRIYRCSNFFVLLYFGLLLALISGLLSLGIGLYSSGSAFGARFNISVIGAGIFTFPIATGLYYITAHYLNNQAELASLFAKVKPLFSVFLAVIILDEVFYIQSMVSVALIIVGLLLFGKGVIKSKLNLLGLILGILTALAWSIGEIFVKVGFDAQTAAIQTFYALSSATIVSIFLWVVIVCKNNIRLPPFLNFTPFIVHGVFSFGIAYTSFFQSIAVIGVVKSVIITSFWPMLSLMITSLMNMFSGKKSNLAFSTWVAALCFICASLLQTLDI